MLSFIFRYNEGNTVEQDISGASPETGISHINPNSDGRPYATTGNGINRMKLAHSGSFLYALVSGSVAMVMTINEALEIRRSVDSVNVRSLFL